MADWSSLPFDLVCRVGDCLLATDDVDYFMDLRAVCRNWRSATDDPKTSPADPRFHPQQWVMLDEHKAGRSSGDDTFRLFLNTTTGRFLRKELPRLGNYYFITSTGGLLILADKSSPHAARIVNPFTASSVCFMAPVPASVLRATAYLQVGASPTLVLGLASAFQFGTAATGYSAEPNAERFAPVEYNVLDKVGSIWRTANQQTIALLSSIIFSFPSELYPYPRYYFVESGGEMLLIRHQRPSRSMEVFKVDAERMVVEPTRRLGSRALFLGKRCLSVDADNIPSIDGNRIFYVDTDQHGAAAIYMYDLANENDERISDFILGFGIVDRSPPFSLIQLLVRYCTDTPWSELVYERRDRQ